ncbi:MAG: pilus assembly protein TadG-related protein [Candidatus Zixiibacteriota bacterium]
MKFLRKILKDEKGASVIMVAVAIVVIFGFGVVAIDMSLIQLAKTQLQNAADAAVLAGAMAYADEPGDQAEKEAAATTEAIRIAGLNAAVQDIERPVVITADDVTFPGSDTIRVTTHRRIDTGDPVTLYFLRVLDPSLENKGDVTARAAATLFCISGTDCLKPFCPPDRWDDVDSNGIWTPDDEYDDVNASGAWDPGEPLIEDWNENGVWDPAEFYDPLLTGYKAPDDVGVLVTLKFLNSNKDFQAGWYYPVRFPPINSGEPWNPGAADYEMWIVGDTCEPYIIGPGDSLAFEPGGMIGPTASGLATLIGKDPDAWWDPVTGTVKDSAFPTSPRIIKAAAFDPSIGVQDGPPRHVVVSKILVLFVEYHDKGDVVGYFMRMATEGEPDPDCSDGGFMYTVNLIE